MRKWKKLMESLNENNSEDHNYTDHEVSMARSQLLSVVKSATNIAKNLKDRNEDEGLEGWVASKLTMAEDYLQAVSDHMSGQALEEGEQKGSCPQCGKSKHVLKACASCGCNEGVEEGKPIKLRGFGPDHKKASGSSLKKIAGMKEAELDEGYKVMPPMDPKYVERKGLEGPFTTLSGKVVYYDSKEGSYYDPDTDMYISYDDFRHYDNDYKDMKDFKDASESIEEEKTRLDPKCWDNKKIGDPKTKMKNGVRVNNCVPK